MGVRYQPISSAPPPRDKELDRQLDRINWRFKRSLIDLSEMERLKKLAFRESFVRMSELYSGEVKVLL